MTYLNNLVSCDMKSLKELCTDLIVIPVKETTATNSTFQSQTFKELEGIVKRNFVEDFVKLGFDAKPLKTLLIKCPSGVSCTAILFVGERGSMDDEYEKNSYYRKLGSIIKRKSVEINATSICICDPVEFGLEDNNNRCAFIEGVELAGYSFSLYKSQAKKSSKIDVLFIQADDIGTNDLAKKLSEATVFARDLVNMPPSDCPPKYLVSVCQCLGVEASNIDVQVFDVKALEDLKANGILCVGKGSSEPPYLVKLTYRPKNIASHTNLKKIALIGKGVTYDSGGLSLKKGDMMSLMKCDMAGVGAIIAAIHGIRELDLNLEISAYLPLAENVINGSAMKPGDIVRTLSGKTVEIKNTDCEGRLLLADALAFASQDNPDVIIDLATLTYSSIVALGDAYGAIFSNDDELSTSLIKAGDAEGERLWRMPLPKDYGECNKSSVADLTNCPDMFGGAIAAALFLKEFIPDNSKWAHIDISGVVMSKDDKFYQSIGATGYGARLLMRYLLDIS